MSAPSPIVLRWRGAAWLPGIPARDITAAEASGLDAALLAEAMSLGLYEEVS